MIAGNALKSIRPFSPFSRPPASRYAATVEPSSLSPPPAPLPDCRAREFTPTPRSGPGAPIPPANMACPQVFHAVLPPFFGWFSVNTPTLDPKIGFVFQNEPNFFRRFKIHKSLATRGICAHFRKMDLGSFRKNIYGLLHPPPNCRACPDFEIGTFHVALRLPRR